ncbi:MAG: FHA domain-containing protein [Mycobacterium sp.]|nr:FHA domain-containing protein [Mycobacterium sp.]
MSAGFPRRAGGVREPRRPARISGGRVRFRVVDLAGLNKTLLNGEPVDAAVLAGGDDIQIGNFSLVFVAGPQV